MGEEGREKLELVLGGVLGSITIVAAIMEYKLGDNGALAGCIKDISSTMIVVILLLISIKVKPRNLQGKLKSAIEEWGNNNIPLIFKMFDDEEGHYPNSYALITEKTKYTNFLQNDLYPQSAVWDNYRKPTSKDTGLFLKMPTVDQMIKDDFEVEIRMSQAHFEALDNEFEHIITSWRNAHKDILLKANTTKGRIAKVSVRRIESKEDISAFVNALDYLLTIAKVEM